MSTRPASRHSSARYDRLGWQAGETFSAELWLNNSLAAAPECAVSWQLWDLRGQTLASGERTVALPAGSALRVGSVTWPVADVADRIFVLRLRAFTPDGRSSLNDYVFSTTPAPIFGPLLAAPQTRLEAARSGDTVEVRNVGEALALMVRLDAAEGSWVEFSDNYLLLAPGELVSVTCAPAQASVRVSGLNLGEELVV